MPQRKTGKERVLQSIKRLVEESEKLEAELSRTEDQLGLARSDATSSWDDRLQRIVDRRAELVAEERQWLKAHEDLDAYLEKGGELSDLYPLDQDNRRRLKLLAGQLGQDTFARLAKFLRRVTAAVPDGETAKEVLTEEQLRSLWPRNRLMTRADCAHPGDRIARAASSVLTKLTFQRAQSKSPSTPEANLTTRPAYLACRPHET